jgi:hypothetical protein
MLGRSMDYADRLRVLRLEDIYPRFSIGDVIILCTSKP